MNAARLLDPEALWSKAVEQIRARRPLIRGWIESAKPLGTEGRFFHARLSAGAKDRDGVALDAAERATSCKSLLKEISGRDWDLKFSLKEGLVVEPPPARNQRLHRPTAAAAQKLTECAAADFKDDPLIRKRSKFLKAKSNP